MHPETLSHYRLLEKIGAGGMGVVYRARDEQLDRDVALKLLPPGMLENEDARRRFRREALALARLNHPNVGAIFEFGNQDGIDFLAMELVSGVTLEAKLAAGPLPETEALRLGTQLADGLEAAHAQGIIHRDLKPGNLRMTADGRLKILDFGLAQWVQPESESAQTVTLTRTQTVSGTVPYMSPEQLRGQKSDERSDIYAAGAVLYEMATGQRPFQGHSGPQLIGAILEKPLSPPSSHNRHVSPALESIILKALDKDPNRRYQSSRELRVDLERLASGQLPVARRTRRHWPVAALGVTAAFLISASLVYYARVHRPRATVATTVPASPVKLRRSVAVIGFHNLSGKPDEAWISTALAEMLSTELAAGEQLRTIPGEDVARMKIELSLGEADSFGKGTLDRIHKRLGTDLVVLGSYLALGKESGGQIRLDYRLQDTAAGETIASVSETGTESQLLDLVSRTGAELRQKLGVGEVSASEVSDVKASLPANPEAVRLYSEGLAKLRVFEALPARNLLEKAVAADPANAPAHSALAAAWSALGYDAKAQEQAKKALDLSTDLSREERSSIEARYRELTRDWPKAIEIYRTLSGFFPDNLDYGLRLALAQTSAGQGKDAITTLESLRQLPPPQGNDPRIDLAEARAAVTLGDFKRQQSLAKDAAQKGRLQGAGLLVAQARLSEGNALERLGLSDQAAAAFAEARQLFAASGDLQAANVALYMTGDLLYDKGDYNGARKMFEEALPVFRRIGAGQNVSNVLNRIGNVCYEQGKLPEAKSYYEQTLKIDLETGSKAGLAGSLGNIANVLDGLGDLQGARKMHEASLQAFSDVGNKRGVGSTYTNLGIVFEELGDLEAAQQNFERAIQVHREIGHIHGEGYAIFGLGDVLMAQGKLVEARTRIEEGLALRQRAGEKGTSAQSQTQLAILSLEEGRAADAEKLSREAITQFEAESSWDLSASASAVLARSLIAQGESAEAMTAGEKAVTDSLKSASRPPRFDAALASARALSASGKANEAAKRASSVLAEAKKYGFLGYEFDARLALAEIQIKSGQTVPARTSLLAIEKDARAKGYGLIAAKAAKLRG